MTIFAQVKNDTVINVVVAEQDWIDTLPSEENVEWIESKSTNQAKIGGIYYKPKGVFCDVQPGVDWTLDDDNEWQPPVTNPNYHDTQLDLPVTDWDDALYQKNKTTGWIFEAIDPVGLDF